MPKKYPPLTPAEVIAVLKANKFDLARQESSHSQYVGFTHGLRRLVTVDMKIKSFDNMLMQSMIRQSGLTRDEFYGSTKGTAAKANVNYRK